MRRERAFTLIELLAVIAVVGLLAALLLPAVARARQKAREMAAKTEVTQLELAWKRYYEEYLSWPPSLTGDDKTAHPIDKALKVMLKGGIECVGNTDNPRLLEFMEFKRENDNEWPVNPWGKGKKIDQDEEGYYYVKFDTASKGVIRGTGDRRDPPTNDVSRSVIVWTWTNEGKPIKSWEN
jgi:prepilin-type N-terminal cleavage/methylation domain-containing protein